MAVGSVIKILAAPTPIRIKRTVHTIGKRKEGGVSGGFVRASKESMPIEVKKPLSPPTANVSKMETA